MPHGKGRGQASILVTKKPKWPSRLPVKEEEVTEEEPSALSLWCEDQVLPLIQCQHHERRVEEFNFVPALSPGQIYVHVLSLLSFPLFTVTELIPLTHSHFGDHHVQSYNALCHSAAEYSQPAGKEGAGTASTAWPQPDAVGPCKSWHQAVGSRSELFFPKDWLNAATLCPHHTPHTQQTLRVVLHKTSPGSCWPWAAPANSYFSYNVLFPSLVPPVSDSLWAAFCGCLRLLTAQLTDSVGYGRVQGQVIC